MMIRPFDKVFLGLPQEKRVEILGALTAVLREAYPEDIKDLAIDFNNTEPFVSKKERFVVLSLQQSSKDMVHFMKKGLGLRERLAPEVGERKEAGAPQEPRRGSAGTGNDKRTTGR